MASARKEMVHNHFCEGKDDKGIKKSAASMIEEMKKEIDSGDNYPNVKHYIPCVSEVTAVIGKMSASRKNQSQ